MPKWTIGTDPEMFLEEKEGGLKSSVGIITGTKDEPLYLEDGVFVMQDNVAVEFGLPPAKSEEEWLEGLANAYSQLESFLPSHLRLNISSAARFPEEELKTREACQFGCDPDFNAWTKKRNIPPRATSTNFRSCGGHVHVGHVDGTTTDFLLNKMGKINTIRLMDAYLGIPSIILDNTPESKERRMLYGKAGCYRETSYGVEYRTLSNFWLKEQAFQRFVYQATDNVVTQLDSNYIGCAKWVGKNGKAIQKIINDGLVDEAQVFLWDQLFPIWTENTKIAYKKAERLV